MSCTSYHTHMHIIQRIICCVLGTHGIPYVPYTHIRVIHTYSYVYHTIHMIICLVYHTIHSIVYHTILANQASLLAICRSLLAICRSLLAICRSIVYHKPLANQALMLIKRDLLQRQKRPVIEARGAYYRGKRQYNTF